MASLVRATGRTETRSEETVQRVLTETGLSEEELSRLYDLKQAVPEQHRRRSKIA